MDETLAEQDFVHKGIVYENISQQPIIFVLARTAEFKTDSFTSDQTVVGEPCFLGVRVPFLRRINAEVADITAIFQTTGIPINNLEDSDGLCLRSLFRDAMNTGVIWRDSNRLCLNGSLE